MLLTSYNAPMNNGVIPPISAPVPPPQQSGQVVQIVSLPEALQNNARAVRLEGEVIAQNKDGSTRIRTSEGDIDMNIRGRQPQVGQKMEVDIPPGNPPRNVTVRNAPPAPAPQSQVPPQTTTPTPQPNVPLPQTPVTQQPLPQPLPETGTAPKPALETYQPPVPGAKPTTPVATPPPTLNTGQIVKLVPMPNVAIPDATLSPQTEKVSLQANITAQKTEGGLITTLLQAVKSALPQNIAANIPGLPQTKAEFSPTGIAVLPQASGKPAAIIPAAPTIPGLAGVSEQSVMQTVPSNVVLEAKIIAIKLPSGQTQIFTLPQPTADKTPIIIAPNDIAAPKTPSAQPITVNVTGFTAAKMPIISMQPAANAPMQNFVLQVQAPMLEAGSQLTITPQITPGASLSNAAVLPPAWRALLPLMQPASLWPVMDDVFQTFLQTTPQAAQILGRIIPSPANPANMGPAIMLFAAALKSGDLQGWMGEKKLEMLQKLGKSSLLSSLSGETSSLSGKSEAPSTEWRSLPIPMLWQNEISKVMFHVRQEPREDGAPEGETGTRFLFDLDLTRMGSVQLDGLVRGNRLDLIVRTKDNISVPMQEAMKKAYADALNGTEIFGELGFQGDLKNWMVAAKDSAVGIDL